MPYQSKLWLQYPPNTTTPQTAAALIAMETRAANYVGAMATGPGVGGLNDFAVSTTGGMGVFIGVANAYQVAVIALDTLGGTERYEQTNGAVAPSVTIPAADPTNPRVDTIVLAAPGSAASAGDSQTPTPQVLAGTPTPGATLTNLSGVQATPARAIRLADVLVPAGAASIIAGNIQDRRSLAFRGVGTLVGAVDSVALEPSPILPAPNQVGFGVGSTNQYYYAVYLGRRVVAATKLRWKYVQAGSGTAMTGSYSFALFEPSGRQIVQTGSQALTGALSSIQVRSEVISPTTFEAGWYIVGVGTTAIAGNSITYTGIPIGVAASFAPIAAPGIAFVNGSGLGVAFPTFLNGNVSDAYTQASAFATGGCPVFSLAP